MKGGLTLAFSFRSVVTAFLFLCLSLAPCRVRAEDSLSFIRDVEIERYLRDLATPLFRAADLSADSIDLYIINDTQLNAFVAEGMNEFINTGLLMEVQSPEQLAGVIAHETGHIAAGHLVRGQAAMKNASNEALLGLLVGVAAGLASGNSQATMAAVSGAQTIAERSFLSYNRAQESSADAAALRYLNQAGYSPVGLLEFMEKLEGQEYLPTDRKSEYVRTHPMSYDRVQSIKATIEASTVKAPAVSAALKLRHERMRAKLQGFLQPEAVLLRSTDHDKSLPLRYARSIALYRTGQTQRAMGLLESLLKENPDDVYFVELKAQMLFETGQIDLASALYARLVQMAPQEALFHAVYGHALLEKKTGDNLDAAIHEFQKTLSLAPKESHIWRFLATAWGRKAENTKSPLYEGLAVYALAEEALAKGKNEEAQRLAERSLKLIPRDSPFWIKAQDIKMSADLIQKKRQG